MGGGQGKLDLGLVSNKMKTASTQMKIKAFHAQKSEEDEKKNVVNVSLVMELVGDKKRAVGYSKKLCGESYKA